MAVLRMRHITFAAFVVWLLVASAGGVVLFNYSRAAGRPDATPSQWPTAAKTTLSPSLFTLVMFVHPKCPCTRASIEELNRLLARHSTQLSTHVLFFKPTGLDSKWTHSASWQSVAQIPGVTLAEDDNGEEARLFGAETSGHVALYNPKGVLLFKGGITAARGHAGDNAGVDMIISALDSTEGKFNQTPVYGCSLLGECKVPTQHTTLR